MIYRIFIAFSVIICTALGQNSEDVMILVGDPLSKVYRSLGSPVMEFPLNGQVIQEYEECSVISSNGIVVSVEYKIPIPTNKVANEEAEAPTIDEIKELALQDDAKAQYLLAYCFQFGKLVEQDYGKAIGWYTKSAMQGHMPAQHNLGYLYMNGKAIERDFEQAYMWALLAAQNGNDSLKKALQYRISEEEKQAATMRAEQMKVLMQAREQTDAQL